MKTAGRENPNRWAKVAGNRAPGADVKNRSSSIKWAVKQEKLRPMRKCFFLTSLFIEPIKTGVHIAHRHLSRVRTKRALAAHARASDRRAFRPRAHHRNLS